MKFLLFVLFSCFALPRFQYVYPYKHSDFVLSYNSKSISDLEYTLTFQVDNEIAPFNYLIISNSSTTYQLSSSATPANIYECNLQVFQETSGIYFSEKDFFTNSSSAEIKKNLVYSCEFNKGDAIFLINEAIKTENVYQLKYKIDSPISENFEGNTIHFYFSKEKDNSEIFLPKNDYYTVFTANKLKENLPGIIAEMRPIYITDSMKDNLAQVLNNFLDPYEISYYKKQSFGVASFNQMIQNLNYKKKIEYEDKNISVTSSTYEKYVLQNNFLGNFIIEIPASNLGIQAFSLFEISFPDEFNLNQTTTKCISIEFKDYLDTSKITTYFEHTKCKINLNKVTFYNVYNIPNEKIRIMITDVINPSLPGNYSLTVSSPAKKLVYFKQAFNMNFESNSLNIQLNNSIRSLNKTYFFNENVQSMTLTFSLIESDFKGESKIELSFNPDYSVPFGNDCVLVNIWPSKSGNKRAIECKVDAKAAKIIVKYIPPLFSEETYTLHFFMENRKEGTAKLAVNIYSLNRDKNIYYDHPSASNNNDYIIEKVGLNIEDIYFLDSDNNKIFNRNFVQANRLKIKFFLPTDQNNKIPKEGDIITLMMNPLIKMDSNPPLLCSIEELDIKEVNCYFTNKEDFSSIKIILPKETSEFKGEYFTLSITGLSYNKVYESPYKLSFEYYLIYSLSGEVSKNYIGMKKAKISLPDLSSPESTNIVLIGGISSDIIPKSLIKAKLFSPRLSELDPANINAESFNNLMVHFYLKNFDYTDFKNSEETFFKKPENSNMRSFFTQAINEESENFREWALVTFYDVQLSEGNEEVEIPLRNAKNKQGEIVVVFYANVDNKFFLPFDQYKLSAHQSTDLKSSSDKIELNWEEDEDVQQNSPFTAFFEFKFNDEEILSLMNKSKNIFILYYLNWNIVESADKSINCQGIDDLNLIKTSIYNEKSNTFLIFQIEHITYGFNGNITCESFLAPFASDTNNLYSAFISDINGNIIYGKLPSEITSEFKFDKINLKITKAAFTPNVLNAPSSHLALYFNPNIALMFPGSLKLTIPSEFETTIQKIKDIKDSKSSKLFTKAYLSLLNYDYIEDDYDYSADFQNDLTFKFDKYEYNSKPITSLPEDIKEPLKLDITLFSESIIENDNNLVIKINVNSKFQISSNHLLLLEIFNLQTPNKNGEIELKLEYELEDQKPIALGQIDYKFSTSDSLKPTFSVSDIEILSIKDFLQPLLSIEIYFNSIIFPNYIFAITASNDFAEHNKQNKDDFIFQVVCENSNIPVILPQQDEGSKPQFQNRLLQDETTSASTDYVPEDSLSSDFSSEIFNLNSAENSNPEILEYKKPYITKKYQLNTDYLMAVEPPSLSGRTLKFVFLNVWTDDTKDLEFNVSLISNYDTPTPDKIFTQLVKAAKSLQLEGNDQIQIENVSNDLEVENVESDFSIKITTDFVILGKPFYLFLTFGGNIILREDNKFLIDGKEYQGSIEAGRLVMLNFQYSRNFVGKSFVLSIPNLKKSSSGSCIASIIFKNEKNSAKKTKVLMHEARINYGSRNIVITELKFSDLKTYNTVDVLFSIKYDIIRAIEIDDVIRFIFPKDFPTAVEYEASNKCEIKICENETFKICSLIDSTCIMIDNYVNVAFKKKWVPKGTENQQIFTNNITIFANITIFGVKTSPNNGKIGSILVFSYRNPGMFYLGENSPVTDEYIYPVLIKGLYSIYRVIDPESTVDMTTVNVLKGTIKRIFLKDFLGLGFKNEMTLNITITGNDKITFFGADEKQFTKIILIKNGDLIKHFDIKIDQASEFYVAYLRFNITSKSIKYQDIPPLKIIILDEKIQVSIENTITMTQGISSFLQIKLSEFPADPLTITITPSSNDIKILGGNQIKFNSSNLAYFFRIRSQSMGNLSYTKSDENSEFAGQISTSNIIIKNANNELTTQMLTFTPSFIPGVGSITINAVLDPFEAFLYYQISDIKKNVAEMPNYRIVESLENANVMKMNLEGSIIGIQECNKTKVICKTKIEGLEVSTYRIKVFIVSYNNITSNVVIQSLEVLSIRPLVLDFGLSNSLNEIQENNFLCSISEFLGINPLLIYSENDRNCDFNSFSNSKFTSFPSNFLEETSLLLDSNSIPLPDFYDDIDIEKFKNLRPDIITNLFLNYDKINDLEQEPLEKSLKIYIYPSLESQDFNLTLYSEKFEDSVIIAYFKSIFPQIDFDFFLKSSSILGKTNSINSFLPILVGTPIISVDVNSIKITIELSDEAVVFGVAVLANATKPTSDQIAKGMNSDGVIGNNCTATNLFDQNGLLNPISLVFGKLKTDTNYKVYFVVGFKIPGNDIIGNNIYVLSATPIDPYKKIGPRILNFEE